MRTFQEWMAQKEGNFGGKVLNTDPNTSMYLGANTTDFEKPNILWITGMNSSGSGPKVLAASGYPVKHISTDVNWPATITGRIKRYPIFNRFISGAANQKSDAHISDQVQKVYAELPKNWEPEIVIGSSQGGAVAMMCVSLFPKAKFILASPAWKVFNVKPQIPSDSIVLAGKKDMQVPVKDSEELSQITGAKLIVTGDSHNINIGIISKVVDAIANQIRPKKTDPTKHVPGGPNPYLQGISNDYWNNIFKSNQQVSPAEQP